MKSLISLVLSLSLAAGITSCKRDYSFLGQRDAAGDITQRYDLGADNRVAADVDGDSHRKYDLGNDVASTPVDLGLDAVTRDLGRDAPAADVRRADSAVADAMQADRYTADAPADSLQRYDAARIDAPPGDAYSPDAGVADGAGEDRRVIIFPDVEIPDFYADGRADMFPDIGTDVSSDLGADVGVDAFNPCPGGAPLNRLQAGVCAGSRNVCGAAGWEEDYSSVVGYEVNEVSCDGLDNDCSNIVDDNLIRPSQECFDGRGECRRSGLEYKTCLGSAGWSAGYSGCDAVEGEPQAELCDGIDRNCNGIPGGQDLSEIIDEFNRPDQAGLGNNALGNLWNNYGSAGDWDISAGTAVTTWTGIEASNPRASSEMGHRNSFHIYVKFNLSEVNNVGGGAFSYSINSSIGEVDGFNIRVGFRNASDHRLLRDGIEIAAGTQTLVANTDYILTLDYDGTTVGTKIWEDGTAEPAQYLMLAAVADVDASKTFTTITGDLDLGENLTVTIDYIRNECE